MIVTCEQCSRRFHLDDNRISVSGSKVRCSKCKHVFKVYPHVEESPSRQEEPAVSGIVVSPELPSEYSLDDLRLETSPASPWQEPEPPSLVTDSVGIEAGSTEGRQPAATETEWKSITLDDLDVLQPAALPEEKDVRDDELSLQHESVENLDIDLQPSVKETQGFVSSSEISDFQLDGISLDDLDLMGSDQKRPEPVASDLSDGLEAKQSPFVDEIYVEDLQLAPTVTEQEPTPSVATVSSVSPSSKGSTPSFDEIEALDLDEIERLIESNQMELDASKDQGAAEASGSMDRPVMASSDSLGTFDRKPDALADGGLDISHEQAAFTETAVLDPKTLAIGSDRPEEEAVSEKEGTEPAERKPVSKTLIVLLILVLLGGGGYALLRFFPDISIPFFSSKTSEPEDLAGNLKIRIFDVNSKFFDSAAAGRLFIVTGKIRNDYAEPRGLVSLKGKLFDTAKKEVRSQTVFCGNVLTDDDLKSMGVEAIQKALSNRLGMNRTNTNIMPGAAIPFMIVFAQLPDQLDEFSLEVVASAKSP